MKTTEMNEIEALFNNKEFSEKITMCNTPAEMAAVFTAAGVEIDPKIFEEEWAAAAVNMKNGELSEEDLDDINGGCGFLVGSILYFIGCVAWSAHRLSTYRR